MVMRRSAARLLCNAPNRSAVWCRRRTCMSYRVRVMSRAPQYYYPPQQVYRAPAAARERTNFGPRIFSQMTRDGR